jgi:hypothetical protein
VPNPNQEPVSCTGQKPAAACATGDPTCIPGTGAARTECLVETVVRGAQGTPVVRCTDNDPACDADPTPGHCGFTVAWCFNNADPRLTCTATGLKRLTVHAAMAPRSTAKQVVSTALGAVTTLAGGTPRRAAVVFSPPFADANRCTETITLPVALRTRGARTRPGKAVLQVTGKANGRGKDVDRLKLICMPG